MQFNRTKTTAFLIGTPVGILIGFGTLYGLNKFLPANDKLVLSAILVGGVSVGYRIASIFVSIVEDKKAEQRGEGQAVLIAKHLRQRTQLTYFFGLLVLLSGTFLVPTPSFVGVSYTLPALWHRIAVGVFIFSLVSFIIVACFILAVRVCSHFANQTETRLLESERDAAFAKVYHCSKDTQLFLGLCWRKKVMFFDRAPNSMIGRELDNCELAHLKEVHHENKPEERHTYELPTWVRRRLEHSLTDEYFHNIGLDSRDNLKRMRLGTVEKMWESLREK